MVYPSVMPKDAKDIESYYTSDKQILSFQTEVEVSSLKDQIMMVTLEACSPLERIIMHIHSNHSYPYFFFYLPLSQGIWTFLPISSLVVGIEGHQCCALSAPS